MSSGPIGGPGLTPGEIVNDVYRVDSKLGQGGMAEVYLATQMALEKRVVIKVLPARLAAGDDTFAKRFLVEARAASRIEHPNAIAVWDYGDLPRGGHFMAMEFVDGVDLSKVIREEGPLPAQRIVHILRQVLAVLSVAHRAGVLHRDLKPSNIMVSNLHDQPDFVKVLDFGLARIVGESSQALTAAGFVCGTPEYMSPEQASGSAMDARSDLYAAVVILYEMLTAIRPFTGPNPVSVAMKQVNEAPLPPRQRRPDVDIDSGLEHVCLAALVKDPAQRIQSAAEMSADLRAAVQTRDNAPIRYVLPSSDQQPIAPAKEPVSVTTAKRLRSRMPVQGGIDTGRPVRVLLVEDDEDLAAVQSAVLRSIPGRGYVVDHAPSFDKAVGMLAVIEYDVCILDHDLGGRTGLELLAEMRRWALELPVVMLTATTSENVDYEAEMLGASEFLEKSKVDARILDRALRYAMRGAQSMDELRNAHRFSKGIIDALPLRVAVLDSAGYIVDANAPWRDALGRRGLDVGANYLSSAASTAGRFGEHGPQLAQGICDVTAKLRRSFGLLLAEADDLSGARIAVTAQRLDGTDPMRLMVIEQPGASPGVD